jgi:hypothetical protein
MWVGGRSFAAVLDCLLLGCPVFVPHGRTRGSHSTPQNCHSTQQFGRSPDRLQNALPATLSFDNDPFSWGCTPLPSLYRIKTDQEMTNFNCNNDPSRGRPRSSTRGQSSPCPPFASRLCNCLVDYSDSTFSMPIPAGCSFHPTERPRSQA